MSVSYIPERVKLRLWGKSAGRCQYEGCNEVLFRDSVTKAEFNAAYIAHIIADKEKGPRGHAIYSEKLKRDLSNLMLLCDRHHRLIDKIDVEGHSVEILRQMKKRHEDRIELQTSLGYGEQSHIVLYGANIGSLSAILSWEKAYQAMSNNRWPAEKEPIELSIKNSGLKDSEKIYWQTEQQNLKRQFREKISERLAHGRIQHMSVFGIAPIPLLIELGRLLSDIMPVDVYQHQKEPEDNWIWSEDSDATEISYSVSRPDQIKSQVALVVSLSATVQPDRITSVLGDEVSIWTISIGRPHNGFLKTRAQLQAFRNAFRLLLDEIKAAHGQRQIIHLFPATPVSAAIEIGRVWSPKADLPIQVYDQNSKLNGFAPVLRIES